MPPVISRNRSRTAVRDAADARLRSQCLSCSINAVRRWRRPFREPFNHRDAFAVVRGRERHAREHARLLQRSRGVPEVTCREGKRSAV
jgi:hypothetical protein